MSKNCLHVPGVFHVSIRLKGDAARATLFHAIMQSVDTGWPWKNSESKYSRVQQCDRCNGLLYQSPRINPADVKAAGRQASVKVMVDRFAPSENCCTESERFQRTRWIEVEHSHRLYRSKEWLEKHAPRQAMVVSATRPVTVHSGSHAADLWPEVPTIKPKIIYMDGTCNCKCHDMPPGITGHGTMFCCSNMFRARRLGTAVDVERSVGIVGPDGEIIAQPSPSMVVHGIASDRALMEHVLSGDDPTGEDEPWGGMVN